MNTCVCAACGNTAPFGSYRCSTIGAATLDYCPSCSLLGAESANAVKELIGEPEKVADWVLVYDPESDWYRYYRDGSAREGIFITSSRESHLIKTRRDLNEYLEKQQKRMESCLNTSPRTPE